MKMMITEKQLATILSKDQEITEIDATSSTVTTVPMAEPASGSKTLSSVPSSAGTSATSATSVDVGSSLGAADYPPYPEVGHWESGVTRGPANQIDTKSNWSNIVGSKLTRGKANPLK